MLFLSSLFRENNKVEVHKFIIGVAGMLVSFIICWTLVLIPVTLPELNGHIFNLIIKAVVFNLFAFLCVLILLKNLSPKFARALGSVSMIVVGVCLLLL